MSRSGKSKSRVGAFFGGTFFGILLGFGIIAGIVCFAYFKVSVNWVNKTFKTDINIGSDKVKDMTINELVKTVSGVVGDMDNYTLDQLKDDFGINIKDQFKGIDITDLKSTPLKDLTTALQTKLTNISIAELEVELISFDGDIEAVLNSSYIYYLNNNTLYKDSAHTQAVTDSDFKYTYNTETQKVTVKDKEFEVVNGEVAIGLKYLPITTALGNFNDLTLANVLGYSYDTASNKYYIDANNNETLDENEEVSTLLNALADTKIRDINTTINALNLNDLYATDERTGIFTLIDNPEKVIIAGTPNKTAGEMTISQAFAKVVEDKTLGQLADADLITNTKFESVRKKWINKDTTNATQDYEQVENLKLGELITISLNLLDSTGQLEESNPTA